MPWYLTVAQYWIATSYILAIAVAADQLRRPIPAWEAAGRERRFWVALTLIMGFHGLGEYALVAYVARVLPRFHGHALGDEREVMQRAAKIGRSERVRTRTEQLVLISAVLVFGSSIIHSAVIADHFEEYWLFGTFFVACTVAQAMWTVLVFREPLNGRVLVAGLVGNALLIVVWMISRTVGVPFGPDPWSPESVGAVDLLSKADELVAVILVAVVLARLRGARWAISEVHVRLAAMVAGPLFIWSFIAAFGGGHHH
jgi:hypothetical protein